MSEHSNDVIDRVRAARRKISERFSHDPDALARHYQDLDQKYQDRMLHNLKREPEERSA